MPRRETPDPYARAVGQRIEQLYKAKGYTLEGLANRMAGSKGHLSNVVRGLAMPTVATLRQIAQALGVHPGALHPEDSVRGQLVARVAMVSESKCVKMVLASDRPRRGRARRKKAKAPAARDSKPTRLERAA
jgi:transcriptional regulator with XRE-family HTH domain